jgi:hypothetical protein
LLLLTAGSLETRPAGVGSYSAGRFLGLRPVTWAGDLSYSLYLWHWPVVVFYVFHLGRAPGVIQGIAIVAISLALAVASYYFVEQKFRRNQERAGTPTGRLVGVPAQERLRPGSGTARGGVGGGPGAVGRRRSHVAATECCLEYARHPGAMAFAPDRQASVPDGVPVRPDPAAAIKDVPLTWMEACGHFDPASLELTNACSARRTRLKQWSSSGHAAQYVDPLVMAGSAAGWKVQAMVRNGCPFTAAPPSDGTTVYRNCSEQNKATMQRILQLRPRLVVVSGMAPTGYRQALKWGWGARMNSSPDMSSS